MAQYFRPYGIRLNAITPRAIAQLPDDSRLDDPQSVETMGAEVPLGRLGQPRDVAEAVLFLASDAASCKTGSNLVVDGALRSHGVGV